MGEKRKQVATILLKIPGKKTLKVEIFRAKDFRRPWATPGRYYRCRSNGRWMKTKTRRFFTLSELSQALRKAMVAKIPW